MTAAFFDVDGTLTRTNVLVPLAWFQRAHLPSWRYGIWLAGLMVQAPLYWLADRIDRTLFVRWFYRRYKGIPAASARQWHAQHFGDMLLQALRPAAFACVQTHRAQGHRIVLVTGNLDFVVAPLAERLGADFLAVALEERDGVFTGRLASPPMVGAAKATALREYAQRHGIVLATSYAYGDSISDAPMLMCVGNPVAVNPDPKLRRLAQQRGWRIVTW